MLEARVLLNFFCQKFNFGLSFGLQSRFRKETDACRNLGLKTADYPFATVMLLGLSCNDQVIMTNTKLSKELQPWIEAKKRHRLSQIHIQMARELGMNPKSFGKLDNHKQEPWKAPLPQFIEYLYKKRFGKETPDVVFSFEQINQLKVQKKKIAKERKAVKKAANILPKEKKVL